MKSSFSEAAARAAGSRARRVGVSSSFRRATRLMSDVISLRLRESQRIKQRLAEIAELRDVRILKDSFNPHLYFAAVGKYRQQPIAGISHHGFCTDPYVLHAAFPFAAVSRIHRDRFGVAAC